MKYVKNGENRGWMIGPMDDMMQLLEDNMVSVQGMAGSFYIGPFAGAVSKLEKILSVMSEVMEAWFVCQWKWMYLEGIFSGGDIREQLPEEANRFSIIDKSYRTVS